MTAAVVVGWDQQGHCDHPPLRTASSPGTMTRPTHKISSGYVRFCQAPGTGYRPRRGQGVGRLPPAVPASAPRVRPGLPPLVAGMVPPAAGARGSGSHPTIRVPKFASPSNAYGLVAAAEQRVDQRFRVHIAIDHDGYIDITGEPRFGPGRDSKPTDQGPLSTGPVEISGSATKGCLNTVHAKRLEGLPTASPGNDARRLASQAPTLASIWASVACGLSRRKRARCIRSPNSYISKASRRRRAAGASLTIQVYEPRGWTKV